jgi:hypothetical protein
VPRLAGLVAAILLAAGCAGSSGSAHVHHHYFLVGKHECARARRLAGAIHPATLPGVTRWFGGVTSVEVHGGTRGIPKPYRRDVVAGCGAAG